MKINHKILSIPPFISISWENVQSLHMEGFEFDNPIVVIFLKNGARVVLPPLDPPIVEHIFATHALYVDTFAHQKNTNGQAMDGMINMGFPLLKMGGSPTEGFHNTLQHNPNQTDSPDIPKEIIDKIVAISKVMGIENNSLLPKAEPHCNCMHCQIARAIRDEKEAEAEPEIEEEVTQEDLTFRLWDVSKTNEKLYLVTNPLNAEENYNVFLGDPVGCTCGKKDCEHILAVLKT